MSRLISLTLTQNFSEEKQNNKVLSSCKHLHKHINKENMELDIVFRQDLYFEIKVFSSQEKTIYNMDSSTLYSDIVLFRKYKKVYVQVGR